MFQENIREQVPIKNPLHQYSPGDEISFTIVDPHFGRQEVLDTQMYVAAVAGGGFFGQVLIPEDRNYVLKTSVPNDPLKYYLRSKNNESRQFAAQHCEIAAVRTVVATRLIASVLPTLTDGQFSSPMIYGYTRLKNGFGYILERVEGRGPRFDVREDEYTKFKDAQMQLTTLALSLGLEHAGQVHQDNPFAMANVWIDKKTGKKVWLDAIPAIPHRKRIWPGKKYRFHGAMRRFFQSETPTFDHIHTDMFRARIERDEHKFTPEAYAKILDDLAFYDALVQQEKLQPELPSDAKVARRALRKAPVEVIKNIPPIRLVADKRYRTDVVENFKRRRIDKDFARRWWIEKTLFRGLKNAHDQGYITDEEYEKQWEYLEKSGSVSGRKLRTSVGLAISYGVLGRVAEVTSAAVGAHSLYQTSLIESSASVLTYFILPLLLAYPTTYIVGKLRNEDFSATLRTMKKPPFRGMGYVGLLNQLMPQGDSTAIHYQIRNLLGWTSERLLQGGMGGQREAKLWFLVGRRLEKYLTK